MKDILIVVLGVALVSAIYFASKKKQVSESFWGLPGRTIKRDPEVRIENKYGQAMFSVPPTYQSQISPRFSNLDYGAYIRYNLPDTKNLASPDFPLTFEGDVQEMYSGPHNTRGRASAAERYQYPNQSPKQAGALDQFVSDASNGEFSTGPATVADLSEVGGGMSQIYNYDRLIVAQKRSRLHGLGDPIRGDIPIAPEPPGWFRPSVQPNIDQRQGAINIIAGFDNSTANELRALQAQYSGKTALAQKATSLGAGQGDVIITAFP